MNQENGSLNSTVNNVYQQPINQNNNSNQSKTKVIGIVIVALVVLVVGVMLFGKSGTKGGYTAKYGETLKVDELNGSYDFDVDVLSIEENHHFETVLYNGDCVAVKVNIKNNSSKTLQLGAYINFELVDSADTVISSFDSIFGFAMDEGIKGELKSGESASGNLYFYNIDDSGNVIKPDASNANRLKVSVPRELSRENGTVKGNYNYYYIELK